MTTTSTRRPAMRRAALARYVAAWQRLRAALAELQGAIDEVEELPAEGWRPPRSVYDCTDLTAEEVASLLDDDSHVWGELQEELDGLGWALRVVRSSLDGLSTPALENPDGR